MPTKINRPWLDSFNFEACLSLESKKHDQLHKLCRNYTASLYLGCPSAKLVRVVDKGTYSDGLSNKELYLQWVKNWKVIYMNLSKIIRFIKSKRDATISLSVELERFKETAQVLLNARYNGKLASAELSRRAWVHRTHNQPH